MLWVLTCFIAIAVGFMMLADVQPYLPDELDFLKNKEGAVAQPAAQVPLLAIEHGWQLRSDNNAKELLKRFDSGPSAGGAVYDAPVLALMCDGKDLHARVDALLRTTGIESSDVTLSGKGAKWPKGQGTNLLAPNATALLRQLTKTEGPVVLELSYVELGTQKVTFDSTGLKAAAEAFPAACR